MKMLLPVMAWGIALATLAGAANELRLQREQSALSAVQATLPVPQWQKQALTVGDYQAIRDKTPVSGSLGIEASAEGLLLRAGHLADYAAWRLTLDQILLENAGIDWQISYLCSGQCEKGDAHQVRLQGKRRVREVVR